MPSKGKLKKSETVSGTFICHCEIRSSDASVPVTFYAKGDSPAKVRKTRKWMMQRIGDLNKLEFLLTPVRSNLAVDVCKLSVSNIEGSSSVRVGCEGPRSINPRGHVHHSRERVYA